MRGTDIVLNFLLNRRTYGECTEVEIVCSKYLHSPLGLASGVGLVGRLGLLGRPSQYVLLLYYLGRLQVVVSSSEESLQSLPLLLIALSGPIVDPRPALAHHRPSTSIILLN